MEIVKAATPPPPALLCGHRQAISAQGVCSGSFQAPAFDPPQTRLTLTAGLQVRCFEPQQQLWISQRSTISLPHCQTAPAPTATIWGGDTAPHQPAGPGSPCRSLQRARRAGASPWFHVFMLGKEQLKLQFFRGKEKKTTTQNKNQPQANKARAQI